MKWVVVVPLLLPFETIFLTLLLSVFFVLWTNLGSDRVCVFHSMRSDFRFLLGLILKKFGLYVLLFNVIHTTIGIIMVSLVAQK